MSCEPIIERPIDFAQGGQQFTIEKGMHQSLPIVARSGKFKSFECEVQFTESCKYKIAPSDQGDQNKLFGFGFENRIPFQNPAHDNSIRWTWRYESGNDILIIPYWYENGRRVFGFKYQKAVKIGEVVALDIYVNEYNYTLTYNNESITIPHQNIKQNAWVLTPFFGGNQKAPHKIFINFLKFKVK